MPSIVTLAEYKTYRGISSGTTTYDTILGEIIDNAEGRIQDYCGRIFAQATYTNELVDGTGAETIQLKHPPVTDPVTSVELLTGVDSWTTLDSSGYRLQPTTGLLVRHGGWPIFRQGQIVAAAIWPEGHGNIRVTYQGGYATLPEGLKSGVYTVCDWLFAERTRNPALASESLGGVSIARPAFETLEHLLDFHVGRYRRGDLL